MFWILHLLAVLFGLWGLIITIPLHMIYLSVKKPSGISKWANYTKCPQCAEDVKREAKVCKHCGASLIKKEFEVFPNDKVIQNKVIQNKVIQKRSFLSYNNMSDSTIKALHNIDLDKQTPEDIESLSNYIIENIPGSTKEKADQAVEEYINNKRNEVIDLTEIVE